MKLSSNGTRTQIPKLVSSTIPQVGKINKDDLLLGMENNFKVASQDLEGIINTLPIYDEAEIVFLNLFNVPGDLFDEKKSNSLPKEIKEYISSVKKLRSTVKLSLSSNPEIKKKETYYQNRFLTKAFNQLKNKYSPKLEDEHTHIDEKSISNTIRKIPTISIDKPSKGKPILYGLASVLITGLAYGVYHFKDKLLDNFTKQESYQQEANNSKVSSTSNGLPLEIKANNTVLSNEKTKYVTYTINLKGSDSTLNLVFEKEGVKFHGLEGTSSDTMYPHETILDNVISYNFKNINTQEKQSLCDVLLEISKLKITQEYSSFYKKNC